ncbi:ROK family protein [Paenibacillus sp. P96]|uniref:ROK family protein n=1 Tax=Paenibacillus zeirhizosphaerae TaxID=2987519 RepID=A0ABT9FTH1_9BACL|nr:ROK family transcriptional regulator [Paenibacillus sp. P96]MDP4098044.1 ROK family protein [Paenibacillus sp. P96]
MNVTGDQALVKKLNRSIVLDTIRLHAPLSRAQVSTRTGLNKATVSNLVSELMTDQLVRETGLGESSGGRKPLMLLFNRTAGYAVGLELSVSYVKGILTDLGGHIVEERSSALEATDVAFVLERMRDMISQLIQAAPPSPHGIVGIGIGVPGMVDAKGTVLFAPNLGWDNAELRQPLESEFGMPVALDNEANAGALGELHYGMTGDDQERPRHLVYISVGSGIGSGIIMDGKPYKGSRGYAGETGHMSINWDGLHCSCGSRGCWELYASERAYDHAAYRLPSHSTTQLLELARQGDGAVHSLYEEIGTYLGIGITNIVNSFNPELVIIGGHLSEARRWLEPSLQSKVAERTLPYHRRELNVRFSQLGSRSTLLGSAYSAISAYLGHVRVSV